MVAKHPKQIILPTHDSKAPQGTKPKLSKLYLKISHPKGDFRQQTSIGSKVGYSPWGEPTLNKDKQAALHWLLFWAFNETH